jgi:predicted esterase
MAWFSVLDFRDSWTSDDAPGATILALHDKGGGLAGLDPVRSMFGSRTRWVAPIAARGIYRGIDNIGRTWFGGTLANPEPASFGDSLAQLERMLYDDRQRREHWPEHPLWIVGVGQGAVLALAVALTVPELINGVIAVHGALPRFRDSTLLEDRPLTMPILMLNPSDDITISLEQQQETVERLQKLGADAQLSAIPTVSEFSEATTSLLEDWWAKHAGV